MNLYPFGQIMSNQFKQCLNFTKIMNNASKIKNNVNNVNFADINENNE